VRAVIAHGKIRPAITSALKRCRVHGIQPRVRDDRDTPLCGVDVIDIDVIWGKREAEYFCKRDWTGQITLIRFNKSGF
jgi:hypothetical protein